MQMLPFCRHLKSYCVDPKHVAEVREINRKQWEKEKYMTENAVT